MFVMMVMNKSPCIRSFGLVFCSDRFFNTVFNAWRMAAWCDWNPPLLSSDLLPQVHPPWAIHQHNHLPAWTCRWNMYRANMLSCRNPESLKGLTNRDGQAFTLPSSPPGNLSHRSCNLQALGLKHLQENWTSTRGVWCQQEDPATTKTTNYRVRSAANICIKILERIPPDIILLALLLCHHSLFLAKETTTHVRWLFLPVRESCCQPQCSSFTPSSLFTCN